MSDKIKILIADNLAEEGVEILKAAGNLDIDYRKKTLREELLEIIPEVHGLIVRSASKVDAEVIEKAENLKVVIRAGVGVDNIDIPACSQKGIVVMNAPAGNSVSTAEQAIALMFATARYTPQANSSMKEKKWEKSKFKGSQLTGKTLGVVGLGRIGKEVVMRGKGLKMNVIGYDPYIPKENLEYLQIDILSLEDLLSKADFITVHTPLTDSTRGLVNKENLSKLKDGVRLINCARGGIYDEAAIAEGLKSGKIAAAGLDVFTTEPPPEDFELYDLDNCTLTPHLGASTDEAQIEVAKETAGSMVSYFKEGVARNSLNFPTFDPQEMDVLAPWFELLERLGNFIGQAVDGAPESVEVEYRGELVKLNLHPLEIGLAKGLMSVALGEDVNLVNAPVLAEERGVTIHGRAIKDSESEASVIRISARTTSSSIQVRATVNFSGGTVIGVNNLPLEFKPEGHILFIRNKDVPRVVGELGKILGDADLNIASLQLSREAKGGVALTVIQVDDEIPRSLLETLQQREFIVDARYIKIL